MDHTGHHGSMIAPTVLAVFFVPLFFVLVQGASEWVAKLLHGRSRMIGGSADAVPPPSPTHPA